MEKRETIAKVLKKAQKDKTFRKKLLESPADALKQEGVEVPKGVRIQFVEKKNDTYYYLLPSMEEELSDQELMKLAAGFMPRDIRLQGQCGGQDCGQCFTGTR